MSIPSTMENLGEGMIDRLKVISGRRIEDERRRRRLTQRQFAQRTGISVRWIREIEAGSPGVKLDDHLRCAHSLQMAPTYIFLPLLCRIYGKRMALDFATIDLFDFEQKCVALAARRLSRAKLDPRHL